jgi:hypothetical protein
VTRLRKASPNTVTVPKTNIIHNTHRLPEPQSTQSPDNASLRLACTPLLQSQAKLASAPLPPSPHSQSQIFLLPASSPDSRHRLRPRPPAPLRHMDPKSLLSVSASFFFPISLRFCFKVSFGVDREGLQIMMAGCGVVRMRGLAGVSF